METKKNSKKSKSSTKSNLKENISQIDSELLEIRKRIYLFEKNIHSKETSPPNPKPSPNTSIKPNPIVHLNYTYQNYPLSYENNSCQTEITTNPTTNGLIRTNYPSSRKKTISYKKDSNHHYTTSINTKYNALTKHNYIRNNYYTHRVNNKDLFTFSKYSFEIVGKGNYVIDLQKKDNKIKELMNTIKLLEEEVQNIETKYKDAEKKIQESNAKLVEKDKIIEVLNNVNCNLQEENKNLKFDNVTLYKLCNEKDNIINNNSNNESDNNVLLISNEKVYLNRNFPNSEKQDEDNNNNMSSVLVNSNNNDCYIKQFQELNRQIEYLSNEVHKHQIEITKSKAEISRLDKERKTNPHSKSNSINIIEQQQLESSQHHQTEIYKKNQHNNNNNNPLKTPTKLSSALLSPSKNETFQFERTFTSPSVMNNNINSIINSSIIFTIYDNKHILSFNPLNKTFNLISFNDLSNFENTFISNGSLLLSLPDCLYIITGKHYNTLFKFSYSQQTMTKVNNLNNNHSYGGVVYIPNTKCIYCISGAYTKSVEKYSLLKHKLICLNANTNYERSEGSYYVYNNKIIFAFFGYNYTQNKYLSNIEYFNVYESNCIWKEVNCLCDEDKIGLELKGHFIFGVGDNGNNGEQLVLIGGYDGACKNNVKNYIEVGIETINNEHDEGYKVNIRKIDKEIVDIGVNEGYLFDKGRKYYYVGDNEKESEYTKDICVFDNKYNMHVVNIDDDLGHTIYYFEL